jgi:hypothetical protein
MARLVHQLDGYNGWTSTAEQGQHGYWYIGLLGSDGLDGYKSWTGTDGGMGAWGTAARPVR